MKLKFAYLLMFFLVSIIITAVEIGLDSGFSSYRYAEKSVNNKDDLYTINSFVVGLDVSNYISDRIKVSFFLGPQIPLSLYFQDAFGVDRDNYLFDLIFFGGNSRLGCEYNLINYKNIEFNAGLFIGYDVFYFKDGTVLNGDEYWFSTIGSGTNLQLISHIKDHLSLELNIVGSLNYINLPVRNGSLLWSNLFGGTIGFKYEF
ncbi:MAG: hypothetical protein JXR64_08875 [Spirochaetales bacterium]|nr:hypothetical protein [Spirochaetales bacterium]